MSDQHPVFHELDVRPKLSFAGPQALWFLNQLTSNLVEDLSPGNGAEALVLTPKGRVSSVLRILATAQGALVNCDGGDRHHLHELFANRVFATKVTVSDVTDSYSILRVLGAGALPVLAEGLQLSRPMPEGPHANLSVGSSLLCTLAPPLEGIDVWIGPERRDEIIGMLDEAGIRSLSGSEYESMRIAAGSIDFAQDLQAGYLPQQAALERAVHYSKGCYMGQEAVAMAQRGRTRKRLRHLEFSGEAATGAATYEGQDAGTVTSAAGGFGIGMIRTLVPVGSEVSVGDSATAVVHELPGTVYGPQAPSARELRERLQGG